MILRIDTQLCLASLLHDLRVFLAPWASCDEAMVPEAANHDEVMHVIPESDEAGPGLNTDEHQSPSTPFAGEDDEGARASPMQPTKQDLDLFLSDEDEQRDQNAQARVTDCIRKVLSELPCNTDDEVSVDQLRNQLMQLTNHAHLNVLIQLLGGLHEQRIPKDVVVSMWTKISSERQLQPKRQRRAKSAANIPIVRSRLLESKRKQAECDLRLLQNRIYLLQQEESRAWKKIVRTKDRAKEILQIREANLRRQEEKSVVAQEREKATRRAQRKQHSLKKESMIKKKHAAIQVISRKYQDVEEVKSLSKQLKAEKERQQMEDVERAREKREAIRRQEEALRRKRATERKHHEQAVALRFMKKMIEEERQIRSHKRKVQEMERAEMELIKRLQGTQLIQREAFSVLEQALLRTDGGNQRRPKSGAPQVRS